MLCDRWRSVRIGLFLGDTARIRQHVTVIEFEEGIELLLPILQVDLYSPLGLVFCEVQPDHDTVSASVGEQSAAIEKISRTRRYMRRSLARMSRMRSSSSSK